MRKAIGTSRRLAGRAVRSAPTSTAVGSCQLGPPSPPRPRPPMRPPSSRSRSVRSRPRPRRRGGRRTVVTRRSGPGDLAHDPFVRFLVERIVHGDRRRRRLGRGLDVLADGVLVVGHGHVVIAGHLDVRGGGANSRPRSVSSSWSSAGPRGRRRRPRPRSRPPHLDDGLRTPLGPTRSPRRRRPRWTGRRAAAASGSSRSRSARSPTAAGAAPPDVSAAGATLRLGPVDVLDRREELVEVLEEVVALVGLVVRH